MTNRTSQPLSAWFLASDVGLTAAGWLAAYLVRFRAGLIPIFRDVPEFSAYVANLPLVVILAVLTYRLAGMYEVHRMRRFREELAAVAKGVGLMALAVMATSFARHAQYESRAAMGLIAAVPALSGLSLTTTDLGGMTVVGLRESPHYGLNVLVKRAMDVVLSAVAIVLLAPLMAVIAGLIKLTSPGPVLYRQERCSLNG